MRFTMVLLASLLLSACDERTNDAAETSPAIQSKPVDSPCKLLTEAEVTLVFGQAVTAVPDKSTKSCQWEVEPGISGAFLSVIPNSAPDLSVIEQQYEGLETSKVDLPVDHFAFMDGTIVMSPGGHMVTLGVTLRREESLQDAVTLARKVLQRLE